MEDYIQLRETAAQMVDDAADEIAARYGVEGFGLHMYRPLVDMATAYLLLLRAQKGLGSGQGLAYGADGPHAALVQKVARRVYAAAHELFECSEIALALSKATPKKRDAVQEAYAAYRRTQDETEQGRLFELSEPMAKRARTLSRAALDRYESGPSRFW